ncbi:unnamed protein product [Closterium sp. Naga37s-1]|nr:unnamed protein product [Closterium sp. Naga37s-1]
MGAQPQNLPSHSLPTHCLHGATTCLPPPTACTSLRPPHRSSASAPTWNLLSWQGSSRVAPLGSHRPVCPHRGPPFPHNQAWTTETELAVGGITKERGAKGQLTYSPLPPSPSRRPSSPHIPMNLHQALPLRASHQTHTPLPYPPLHMAMGAIQPTHPSPPLPSSTTPPGSGCYVRRRDGGRWDEGCAYGRRRRLLFPYLPPHPYRRPPTETHGHGGGPRGFSRAGTTPEHCSVSTPHPTLFPTSHPTPTSRQAGHRDPKVRAAISDLLAIQSPSRSPVAPTLPVPQVRTRTYAEVTRSVPSSTPPTIPIGLSLPSPMETDLVLRPCHLHPDVVVPPPIRLAADILPVAQEGTSIRYEASAPADTPPPRVAEPPLQPHPAEGEGRTTARTSGPPPHPPSLAPGPVRPGGSAPSSVAAPPPPSTPLLHRAGESSPTLIPGDPLGAQAAHGTSSTAPIDPTDTATSPDQVMTCPTCRSPLANRRALQHHTPFCHPADAARRAQAVHDTTSILPSLSQPRATGIQFIDAQW